ncbi:uncharacterized protein SYNPCC7002_A1628 isoform X2 [Garra rufa]|uniref:uncharacterized protein SYNPCC7002_A1628 isoform X2 n=1 Tax=Garra rufa TaxID=137080 RepID=UPI003CCE9E8F
MFHLSCQKSMYRAAIKCKHVVQMKTLLKRNPMHGTWRRSFNAEHTCLESRALPIVHHVKYICDLPENHRFPMGKFPKVLESLLRDQVITDKQVWAPKIASTELLGYVHTEEYLSNFISGNVSEKDQRRTGFPWSSGLVQRCRYETGMSFSMCFKSRCVVNCLGHILLFTVMYSSHVRCGPGGTVLAGEIALQRGLASSTAGGTHHAFPSYGSGFCLLNDLAVAAKHLMGESTSRRRILIVDLDVHQGDGTAFMFKDEPDVFTFSVHCGKNFPVQKQQSDLDVSLEDGTENKEYLSKGILYLHRNVQLRSKVYIHLSESAKWLLFY